MDVDSEVHELQGALAELKCMMGLAKRPNVVQELQRVQENFERQLARATSIKPETAGPAARAASQAQTATKDPAPVPTPKPAEERKPVAVSVKSAGPWTEITTFALDLGGYDKPIVTVDIRMKGVEALPADNITCDFTGSSFDLKIVGFEGANHRMLKTNLDKDIVPGQSSFKVKKNHVLVSLHKVKGEYAYDSWADLCAKGRRKDTTAAAKEKPQDSIMTMMKDLYEDGDDNMKKIIGEAMYKAQRGEKYDPKETPLPGPEALGGLGDMDS